MVITVLVNPVEVLLSLAYDSILNERIQINLAVFVCIYTINRMEIDGHFEYVIAFLGFFGRALREDGIRYFSGYISFRIIFDVISAPFVRWVIEAVIMGNRYILLSKDSQF